MSFGGFGQQSNKSHNPNNDIEIQGAPSDVISGVRFNPPNSTHGKQLLCASSWDKTVRIWEVQRQGDNFASQGIAQYTHDQPVLCCTQSKDGKIFSGGCDNFAKCFELGNQGKGAQPVAQHDQPIKCVIYCEELSCLITGGWDNNIRFWDLRQQTPVHQFVMPGPIVDMDCTFPMLTACDSNDIVIYNLQQRSEMKRQKPHQTMKEQLRCVANFPEVGQSPGFAAGSIEGRVCIMWMNETGNSKNYSFKCHRENENNVYAVHSICFHPFGTFSTTGGNGGYSFWDKDAKTRLKQFSNCNQSIPCGRFNQDGSLFAYAVTYDWARGAEGYDPSKGHHLLMHKVQEAEVRKKTK